MNRILCGGILLFAISAFAQQQGPPYGSAPHSTPPTFPSDQAPHVSPAPQDQTSQQPQLPPDVAPPQTERPSSSTLESSLRQKMAAEPMLKNAKLDVRVTDRDIVVSGTVDDRRQHDVAIQVVQSNAGDRQVVDKIKERS
jgi:hypothetical protein